MTDQIEGKGQLCLCQAIAGLEAMEMGWDGDLSGLNLGLQF